MRAQIPFGILVLLVAPILAATVGDVLRSIQNISAVATTLDAALIAFPNTGGTLSSASTIHINSASLVFSINAGTSSLNDAPKPMSEADYTSVLSTLDTAQQVLLDVLRQFIGKKAGFQAVPPGGWPSVVKQDLDNLGNAMKLGFEPTLISSAPADLVARTTSIKTSIDAAFANAIAAYS